MVFSVIRLANQIFTMIVRGHMILLFFLAGQAITNAQTNFYDYEKSLRTDKLSGYEYKIRPEATVECDVRLSLLNINILDVTGQRLSVSGWLTIRWNDSRLSWDPALYGNITDFYDTELVLWRPQLIVDNEISNLDIIESDKLLIRATERGEMTWEPPAIYETHCDVDVTFYPFDTQMCIVEVTSWSYTLNEVNLAARDSEIYLEDFELSGEWEILKTWSERRLLIDGEDLHSQIDFNMKLRRRPSYYVMTILIPVIVTSILCILVFLLPAESGEKVGYTLTILLTYVVMLTLVAGYMPPTSKSTSVLSIYLTIVLFLGVFSTLATVFVLYFHHHDNEKPVYDWMITLWVKLFIPLAAWKKPKTDSPREDDTEIVDAYVSSIKKERNRVHPASGVVNGKPGSTSPRRPSTRVTSRQRLFDDRPELTWQELSIILDKALFKVLGIFILLLTVVVLLTLIIGGYS